MTTLSPSVASQAARAADPNFGVGTWIERRARLTPDRPALIAGDEPVTYSELAARIRRLANGFRSLGVVHGDRIAWLGDNHPAFLETLFAAGLIGAVLAPANHRLSVGEIEYVLEDAEPVLVLEHGAVPRAPLPASVRQTVAVGPGRTDAIDFEALIAASPDSVLDDPVRAEDLLLLQHTSGTTGNPKGVMLTHANVTWNAINFVTCADYRGSDVSIAVAPFFRVGGTGVNVLPILFLGGTVVVPEDREPDHLLSLIEQHRVTVGFGNPDILEALVGSPRWLSADLSSIRFIVTGGAPVPERLLGAYSARELALLQGYGLSEAAPLALLLDAPQALGKIGSAGKPPPFVDIAIVDDDGREVDPGQIGELLVRGPNVMAGYWRQPAATSAALLPGGWLRTGDAARADGEGYVWIVDRASARFVTASGTVYPWQIESALLGHPAVRDAGVVGVPTDGGAVAVAFVVLSPGDSATPDELLAFVRARLPTHAVPASVTFMPELPRTSVGKLRRNELLQVATSVASEERR